MDLSKVNGYADCRWVVVPSRDLHHIIQSSFCHHPLQKDARILVPVGGTTQQQYTSVAQNSNYKPFVKRRPLEDYEAVA